MVAQWGPFGIHAPRLFIKSKESPGCNPFPPKTRPRPSHRFAFGDGDVGLQPSPVFGLQALQLGENGLGLFVGAQRCLEVALLRFHQPDVPGLIPLNRLGDKSFRGSMETGTGLKETQNRKHLKGTTGLILLEGQLGPPNPATSYTAPWKALTKQVGESAWDATIL